MKFLAQLSFADQDRGRRALGARRERVSSRIVNGQHSRMLGKSKRDKNARSERIYLLNVLV